jgi:hypothetical protein
LGGGVEEIIESEIEQLGPVPSKHHVCGLQVPIHNPVAVCPNQRVQNLHSVSQSLFLRQRPFPEALGERFSFQILHHQEIDSVLPPNVVHTADVRMFQAGDGSGLAFETVAGFGPIGKVGRQNLNGDGTVEARVLRVVNLSIPPAPIDARTS